ncbi:hypothetical protein EVAR_40586_1 [Eumeta japonica]|uniref:Uncharacterized protein n=1 Tax=Eumeta variegata TaxID=151549 RepID=A0A4C1VV93_EUMVA|nr:hypothetical protein EVAR_40586_1 [Eumeta japonica]
MFDRHRSRRVITEKVVIVAHGHSQRKRSHRCVAGVLRRNIKFSGGEIGVMETGEVRLRFNGLKSPATNESLVAVSGGGSVGSGCYHRIDVDSRQSQGLVQAFQPGIEKRKCAGIRHSSRVIGSDKRIKLCEKDRRGSTMSTVGYATHVRMVQYVTITFQRSIKSALSSIHPRRGVRTVMAIGQPSPLPGPVTALRPRRSELMRKA